MVGEYYFRKLVSQLYFENIKRDIESGNYQIIQIPYGHVSKHIRDDVVSAMKRSREITTFIDTPKTGFCHILRHDYVKQVLEALKEMGIKATKDDVYRALRAQYTRKQFGSKSSVVFKFYCVPVPDEIRSMLLSRAANVVP